MVCLWLLPKTNQTIKMDDFTTSDEGVLKKLLGIKPNGYPPILNEYDLLDLSLNPSNFAVNWLIHRDNRDNIKYHYFCMNENDKAIDFLLKTFKDGTWHDKIFPGFLHKNKNPRAQRLIDIYVSKCGFDNRQQLIDHYHKDLNEPLII